MRWWLVPMTILTVACSESKRPCGGKVLVLWPSSNGEYQPTVVATPTLRDARKLSGPAANIYYESRASGQRSFAGPTAEPHVTNSGDVCVPTDAGSAVAISAYAQFERLHEFDQKLGVADQVSWPRQVGVETKLNGRPGEVENNAHYMGEKDLIILVPSTMPGVPVAMNLGVVAHEHFHAHFQSQVLSALAITSTTNLVVNLLPTFLTDGLVRNVSTLNLKRQANDYVLRGWNEGLADFYASVYLNQPDFLAASFGTGAAARARVLNGPALVLGTDQIMSQVKVMNDAAGVAVQVARETLSGLAYGQGAALARALWTVVQTDLTATPEQNLGKIMRALDRLPKILNDRVNASELHSSFVLPILLADLNLSPAACAGLLRLIPPNETPPRIPQCEAP